VSRSSWTLAGFFAAGVLAAVAYSYVTRVESTPGNTQPPLVAAAPPATERASPQDEAPPSSSDPAVAAPDEAAAAAAAPDPKEALPQLLANATSEDAEVRAGAITALANAPKDAALPVLKRVLTRGEPEVDRPLALSSLRTLALLQGDADGRIRDTLRQTVSHADSEQLATSAQLVVDELDQRH
jgi:hypothetical protein